MIKKLYEAGCFNFQKFILDNIKKLSLNSNEALVLIKLLEKYPSSNILSRDDLASDLAISKSLLEETLYSLLERKFYEEYIKTDNGIGQDYFSVDCFFDKVEAVLNTNLVNLDDELYMANQYVTAQMNRVLTAKELEILTSLIKEDRYTTKDIERAVEILKGKNKLITIKNIAQSIVVKEDIKISPTPSVVKDFFKSIK